MGKKIYERIGKYKITAISDTDVQVTGPDKWGMVFIFTAIGLMSLGTFYSALHYDDLSLIILEEIYAIFLSFILFRSYYHLVKSDPGIIPSEDSVINHDYQYKLEVKSEYIKEHNLRTVEVKYWYTWKIIRPPRSFHWPTWNIWIERHDHHWLFTGGCIGIRNHKKFISFLLMTVFVSTSALFINAPIAYDAYRTAFWGDKETFMLFVISFIVSFIEFQTAFSLFLFSMFHFYMASNEVTSNEWFRKTYKSKPNPYKGIWKENLWNFWYKYPNSEWNLFKDKKLKGTQEDLNSTKSYSQIIDKYGKLTRIPLTPMSYPPSQSTSIGWLGKKNN